MEKSAGNLCTTHQRPVWGFGAFHVV